MAHWTCILSGVLLVEMELGGKFPEANVGENLWWILFGLFLFVLYSYLWIRGYFRVFFWLKWNENNVNFPTFEVNCSFQIKSLNFRLIPSINLNKLISFSRGCLERIIYLRKSSLSCDYKMSAKKKRNWNKFYPFSKSSWFFRSPSLSQAKPTQSL